MKRNLIILVVLLIFSSVISAREISGVIIDKESKEPVVGVMVLVEGSSLGTITDENGAFELDVDKEGLVLILSHLAYEYKEMLIDSDMQKVGVKIELVPSMEMLDESSVVTYRNEEAELVLLKEREVSVTAVENIGSKEMSLKGLSNAEDGVKKMTGVSVADAGQIVVRGLGDRYSITTLNGLPIASPNPDNKLAPLDIFPSAAVKNITVSKVFDAKAYADYSGAHIDIATKNYVGNDFFSFSLGLGANLNTVGKDFYRMDHTSLFTQSSLPSEVYEMSKSEFVPYAKENNIFDTDFSVSSTTSLPTLDGTVAFGKNFKLGDQALSVLAAAGVSNKQEAIFDSEYRVAEAGGAISDTYTYDSYKTSLNMTALANVGLSLRDIDKISYTAFFARNAEDTYQLRFGETDNQGHVVTSNSVNHIYTLVTNQLQGFHSFSNTWTLDWDLAYTFTSSDEPDRRQVMFTDDPNGGYMLFTNDQQATMRYFGSLDENQIDANLASSYKFGKSNLLTFGASFKNKDREYNALRFYYDDLYSVQNEVEGDDFYNTDGYLNFDNIKDGTISVDLLRQPNDSYTANNRIVSGYATLDLDFNDKLLVNMGLRYEYSIQSVNYYDQKYDTRKYKVGDLFPALNLKYSIKDGNQLRFAFSRTVTRPSFVEMAPFLYQESYGSAQIIGNENLINGYNYNLDLRYENFFKGGDMFSATAYFKQLIDPIERVQQKQGGSTLHTFKNAENGIAAGLELEYRKKIADCLSVNINGSYMYTDIKLTDGAYTNKERQLQGASPYLFNADLVYTPKLENERLLSFALLYNLQGPRIHAVGLNGQNDIIQKTVSRLNFVASYQFSESGSIKIEVDNLLNAQEVYEQKINNTGKNLVVERHTPGLTGKIGISFKF